MTDSDPFTINVVEDDVAVLDSFCALLAAHGYRACGYSSAEAFLDAFDATQKAAVLLDLHLSRISGVELLNHLSETSPHIPVIVVTAHGDIPLAVKALRAGAVDFLEKPTHPDHILESVALAERRVGNLNGPGLPKQVVDTRLAKLTERERQVMEQMLLGRLNKEIAKDLDISRRTVEVHRSRVFEKMQVRGIADLFRILA